MKKMKYFENNQNVTQKHKVNKCYQKNATDRLMVVFPQTLICKKSKKKKKKTVSAKCNKARHKKTRPAHT